MTTKLNWDTAQNIRLAHASGVSTRTLAEHYDVGIETIRAVIRKDVWRKKPETVEERTARELAETEAAIRKIEGGGA